MVSFAAAGSAASSRAKPADASTADGFKLLLLVRIRECVAARRREGTSGRNADEIRIDGSTAGGKGKIDAVERLRLLWAGLLTPSQQAGLPCTDCPKRRAPKSTIDPAQPGNWTVTDSLPPALAAVAFRHTQTESFVALRHELRASLLVTTYQANKGLVVRADGPGLSTLVRTFERPMGLAVGPGRLALGTRNQIWLLPNAPDLAARVEPAGWHDACYLPRSSHTTGDVGVHEVAWAVDELWLVNTRFSCLCTQHPDYSFVPRWRPPFIFERATLRPCRASPPRLFSAA
jgi:hypothetical protein